MAQWQCSAPCRLWQLRLTYGLSPDLRHCHFCSRRRCYRDDTVMIRSVTVTAPAWHLSCLKTHRCPACACSNNTDIQTMKHVPHRHPGASVHYTGYSTHCNQIKTSSILYAHDEYNKHGLVGNSHAHGATDKYDGLAASNVAAIHI